MRYAALRLQLPIELRACYAVPGTETQRTGVPGHLSELAPFRGDQRTGGGSAGMTLLCGPTPYVVLTRPAWSYACPVLTFGMALPGGAEELRTGTTREPRRLYRVPTVLGACYAMLGTDLASHAGCLRAC
eukprot:2685361-Rhodomonas_salina.2